MYFLVVNIFLRSCHNWYKISSLFFMAKKYNMDRDENNLDLHSFFKGLTIVELSSVLAGPLVGSFFAELGARVVKIENKQRGGDPTRNWKLPSESKDSPISAYYVSANIGKESLMLDLGETDDRNIFNQLISEARVVISNLNDTSSTKLKIDFSSLKKINPHIIYAQLYAFDYGEDTPGYDVVMQAECGYIGMCGSPDKPAKIPVAMIDILAAEQMKNGILMALIRQSVSNKAIKINVSLFKSGISALINQAANYLMEGYEPERMGTMHPNIAPYGDLFECSDKKWIILAIGSDEQFNTFAQLMKFTIKDQEHFSKNANRVEERQKLNGIIQNKINDYTSTELCFILNYNRIPHGQVKSLKEVFNHVLAESMIMKRLMYNTEVSSVSTLSFTLTE